MINLKNLKYVILSGKFPNNKFYYDLHNRSYLFWKEFWNDVFKENNTDHKVYAEDFWRQDMITMLIHNDIIIGQHFYSFFNIESLASLEHNYIRKSFTEEYIKELKKKNVKRFMSMEYLAITPGYRKKDVGFSIASVLIGLACEHQKLYNIDALVGPSRSDKKVTQLTLDFGGDIIIPNLIMHNTPVDLVAIFLGKTTSHPEFIVNKWIYDLWKKKEDATLFEPITIKIAG